MRHRTLIILISIFATVNLTFSQEWEFREIRSIEGPFSFLTSDELGNVYTVYQNKLIKRDLNGTFLYDYSPFINGDISFVDAGDPFKILVFYQDFGLVEWLDNTLSPVSKIDLNDIGMDLATLACNSYQNGIWFYLPPFLQLKRFDQFLNVSGESGNLYQATGIKVNPNFMVERDNILYLSDPSHGILLFDKYGTFSKIVGVKGLSEFQVLGKKLVFLENKKGVIIDPATNMEESFELPADDPAGFRISAGTSEKRLFMLLKDKLVIYSIR